MKDIDVKQFLKIPKVTPTIKPDKWDTLLIDKPSKYKFEKKHYLVEALDTYAMNNVEDGVLHRVPQPGERWIIDEDRLEVLKGYNFGRRNYVRVLKEITEEEYKKIKKGNNNTR